MNQYMTLGCFSHCLMILHLFRKITVHDSNVALFRQFLEYLYCGQLDTSEMTTEQLADLMALADRYEVGKTDRLQRM